MTDSRDSYCVEVIGFNTTERLLLSSIFGLAARRDPSFVQRGQGAGRPADLYLVDGNDPGSMVEMERLRSARGAPAVVVGNQVAGFPTIERPMQWSRVLAAFDDAVGTTAAATGAATDAVLVVDDNATVRNFMAAKLAPFGFRADFAETGEQAVGLTGQKEYTCVFLDVVLPGIDGYQVCKLIKSNKQAVKRTAVVMLTGRSSPFDKLRGSLAGCDEYLTKPVDENHLLQVIAKFLPMPRAAA